MVEAARIELASEDISTEATTCFSYLLLFASNGSDMQDQSDASSNEVSLRAL